MYIVRDPLTLIELAIYQAVLSEVNRQLGILAHHDVKVGGEITVNSEDGLGAVLIGEVTVDSDRSEAGSLLGKMIQEAAQLSSNHLMILLVVTDATGNEYGQAEPILTNAISIVQMPKVNIHQYSLPAGRNTIRLPKGILMVAGFTQSDIHPRDCGLSGPSSEVD